MDGITVIRPRHGMQTLRCIVGHGIDHLEQFHYCTFDQSFHGSAQLSSTARQLANVVVLLGEFLR